VVNADARAVPTAQEQDVPVLALRNLSKSFGGAHALQGVSLTIRPREVHGLLGQNGSGKSTLIKILAGYHAPEPGAVLEVHGERVRLPLQPGQFRDLGMSFVHQDLALIPSLSVTENLRLGELAAARRWHISWDRERRRAAAMFERYGVQIDPQAMVADISAVDRALLGIIRAVEDMRASQAARHDAARAGRGLLVLDEPTAFLPRSGVEQLFALIREIVAGGASVLFVSHNLDEVLRITDRITVLRDGRLVGTIRTTDATEARLIEMIIGRRLASLASDAQHRSSQTIAAQVEGLYGGSLHDVSIDLHEGEVVGMTGLLGSGFEDLPYLIFGARPATAGQLTLKGRHYDLVRMTPAQAIAQGIALVPADRQNDGSIGSLSVADNITMQVIDHYIRAMRLDRTRMRRDAEQLLQQFDVRPPEPRLVYQELSGGNQQKVLLAKWFQTAPALILLHEPTLGVDVGARQQIYTVIRDAARAGAAVVCASADYEQLAAICDRVVIVARGRVARQLVGADLTKDRIAEQCLMSVTIRA
jgi:ribose transport system ATP-binding protein